MRVSGMTYQAIQEEVKVVSCQRIQQILRPDWRQRKALKQRAGGRCERCKNMLAIGYGHIHHLRIDVGIDEWNDLSNLTFVCPSCHRLSETVNRLAPPQPRMSLVQWAAVNTCTHCGRVWKSHKINPKRCCGCGSPNWHKPRKFEPYKWSKKRRKQHENRKRVARMASNVRHDTETCSKGIGN